MASGVQRFARDVSFSFASLGITALVHFILRVFLARYLGAGDLGLYTLSFTVYSFGMLFSVFGIGAALTKYVAQYKEDTPKTKFLVSSGSITALLIGCATGLILYFCSAPIANIFFDMPELGGLLRIVSFVFPFIALEKATLGFLNGLRQMRLFALISITQSILTIILTIALVLCGYGPRGAVLSFVLPIVLMSLFSLFSIRKSLAKPKLEYCKPAIKMLLAFGGYVILANSVDRIQAYSDSIMLGYFMKEIDVGIYAVAILLSQAIRLPSQAIQMITSPTIATHWGNGNIDNIEKLINKAIKYTAVFIVPVSFLVVFLAREIITLIFSVEFVPAVFPFQILVIGAVVGAIQASVGGALSSTAYVSMIFKISGITSVANVILNLLLIPRLGITGAAIATSTSMVVGVLLHLYFTQRLIGVRIHWGWFAKLFAFTALLAAATYGLGLVVNHYLAICLGIIGLIAVLLTRFITKEDIHLMRRILH